MATVWSLGFDGDEGWVSQYIFSSKNKARKFNKLFEENYELLEFEIDPYEKEMKENLFPYKFILKMDGSIPSYCEMQKSTYFENAVSPRLETGGCIVFDCNIVAKTKDEALDIGKSEMIKLLKNGNWVSPIDSEIAVRENVKNFATGQCWYPTHFMGNLDELIKFKQELSDKVTEMFA